jgi:hypothetical protein
MQDMHGYFRGHLTDAQVIDLIQGSETMTVDCGLEIIDKNLNYIDDISTYLSPPSSTVSRGAFNELHGSCVLNITKPDHDWPNMIVRPYFQIKVPTISLTRWNMGAYYLASPRREIQTSPGVFEADGFDIMLPLSDLVGQTYSIPAGNSVLTTVEGILTARGFTQWTTDWSGDNTLPSAKVYPIDDQTKWLTIINDLLNSIGYQGIWSDWDGRLHIHPYTTPINRASEWTYDTTGTSSIIYPDRVMETDFFDTPNRWVFVRQNNTSDAAPVEGNGIYTFNNIATGATSQAARGRVITKVMQIDAADQPSLINAAQITIDADMAFSTKVELSTSPNPMHWHFDRLTVIDPVIGFNVPALSTDWTLNLDGTPMTHKWTLLS